MDRKIIANKELEAIGGKPKVYRYWDEKEKKSIDILSCMDRPYSGIASYATIGLSEYNIGMISDEKQMRLELVGACDEKEELFPNILSTTAFEIMDRGNCGYGYIIPNVISQYINNCEMKHIYLTNPFLWEGFNSVEYENTKIAWLLIVPISNQEREYAKAKGWEALETKFEEANIDIFDIKRLSVI